MTQLEDAKKGIITEEMKAIAKMENISEEKITRRISEGTVVIPKNINRNTKSYGIGEGLTTKVNANIGSSSKVEDINVEIEKAKIAVEYGADAVMDLSTGPKLNEFREKILEAINVPIGTVPIYEAGVKAFNRDGSVNNMTEEDIFKAIENQAKEGIDFMTLHCGINKDLVYKLKDSDRTMGIVSRGGTFLYSWILENKLENPLFENYDYILEIAKEHDVTLSLGDGLRPGCLSDATDIAQVQELVTLGTLVKKAREFDVQVMVEGPGHVPLDQVASNMKIQKTICKGAPFYVLGPIVTDLAPGYDHITSAIGGAVAAASGADFLCYVTPAEHLGLPSVDDVKEGVIASKIAAQAGDVALGLDSAWAKEKEMAAARENFDWDKQFELSFNRQKAKEYRNRCHIEDDKMCSMCGEYCSIRIAKENRQ
ncbi:phosphomethylpyrimidine synthase [Methanobrevibacter filiformis]|uniref:Phosphomethylpyrimidine synthase n=1 Tax=Methanobrevibacter filiformis TaxID=55758 RepID=A0A166AI40_9EURY|nr:phosphomethylpyrimidine synthase [Methanobrevibacter filiformis]KZX12061.1 phosphomethylpyrimidine synthase [Methanobrevibacter filiformis]